MAGLGGGGGSAVLCRWCLERDEKIYEKLGFYEGIVFGNKKIIILVGIVLF